MSFLKLIRITNLIIIALTQYAIRYLVVIPILKAWGLQTEFSDFNFLLLVLATVFMAAGGYVINDYFDTKTDILNKPDRVVVGVKLSHRKALLIHFIFSGLAVLLGFYVSYSIGIYQLGFIFLLISGLLWYYSTSYKNQFLIGNLIVATLTAMVPLMPALFEIPPQIKANREFYLQYPAADLYVILYWGLGFAFFAFITTLIREIIKDIEDFEGDSAYGSNTIPIVLGTKTSKYIVNLLIIITIIALIYTYFNYLQDQVSFLYILVLIIIPLLYLLYNVATANEKKDFRRCNITAKLIMLSGILYSIVAYYNLTNL